MTNTREPQAGPYRLLVLDSLVSTNDAALNALRGGDRGGLVIRAVSQTGGRGRQGRLWRSPPGNLYASLALRLDLPPSIAPQLGFVTGVALANVLRARLAGDKRLQIKWPNDIVFAGAKLSGLLLESVGLADGRIGCVIGFGVNCRSHPRDLPYPATDLVTCGDPTPDPAAVLDELAVSFAYQLDRWNRGAGFADIRASWLTLAIEEGTPLTVTLTDRQLRGAFRGLDAAGRLLIETGAGREAVDAGDVFLATAETQDPLLHKR